MITRVLAPCLGAWIGACANVDLPYPVRPLVVRTTPTHGSALVISRDRRIAVATNRTAHTVSVFDLTLDPTPPTARRRATIRVPNDAMTNGEPWAAVIGNDDDTAYVILRRSSEVLKITGLHTTPRIAQRAPTGSEPTGIAISPRGARIYVSNWAEGTVTEVNTANMAVVRTIDLNASLAGSGMLGRVASRLGLAHPRAIVVTNNNNTSDADETVYVTEFFSQARTADVSTDAGVPTDDSAFDVGRQGVVYRFNAVTGVVESPIKIAPVADTGFRDAVGSTSPTTGAQTGCFPNQLYAAALNNDRLYVTSVCESPRGPTGPVPPTGPTTNFNNFKTELHAAVFVIDTGRDAGRDTRRDVELPAQGLLLTRAFQNSYDEPVDGGTRVHDDVRRRMPLIPNDIAFAPGTSVAYISSYGSDAAYRVAYNANGTLVRVGAAPADFIQLDVDPGPDGGVEPGHLPIGVAVASTMRMLVLNENSRNLQLVDLTDQTVKTQVRSADAPVDRAAEINNGRRFFVTGLGRWSLRGQGWNSCEACHPDGLTDNVTWFFARGPRQTPSLDGTYDPAGRQRVLNWTAVFDEVHDFELNTRGNSGGVGAIVHRPNNGAADPVVTESDRIIFDGTMPVPPQVATTTNQTGLNGSTRQMMPAPVGMGPVRSVLNDWEQIDLYVRSIRAPHGVESPNVTAGRNLFVANNCSGCHGSPAWTTSRVSFAPGAAARGDQVSCVLRAVGTFPATLDAVQNGVAPMDVRVREVRENMSTVAEGATGYNPPSLVGLITGAPYFHAGNARTLEEVFDVRFQAHYTARSPNFLSETDRDLGGELVRDRQIRHIVEFLRSIDDDTDQVPITGGVNPDLCPP